MMCHPAWHVLFASLSYFVIPLYGYGLPDDFEKCERGDDECFVKIVNDMIQHPERYKPGLPIPKLDPYVSPCPFVLESTSITSILNAEIHWENITVYGAQNAVVQKISGLPYDESSSIVRMTGYVPNMKLIINTKSKVGLSLLHLETLGQAIANIENIEGTITGNVTIIKRDGRSYVTYSDVFTTCDAQNVQINVKYRNIPPFINDLINRIINTNWRICKESIHRKFEEYAMNIVDSMVKPVFAEMAFEDFCRMK